MRPSRNSKTCKIRNVTRRPLPGIPSIWPVTVPVIIWSRIMASSAKYRCDAFSSSVWKLDVRST